MTNKEKTRENRARRVLLRLGYRLMKSKRKDPRAIDYGGYMIVDDSYNVIVEGSDPIAFSMDIEDVEKFIEEA